MLVAVPLGWLIGGAIGFTLLLGKLGFNWCVGKVKGPFKASFPAGDIFAHPGARFAVMLDEETVIEVALASAIAPVKGQPHYQEAMQWLETWIENAGVVHFTHVRTEKDGTVMSHLQDGTGADCATEMLRAGFAHARRPFRGKYKRLEAEAKEAGRGIWYLRDAEYPGNFHRRQSRLSKI